MKKQPTLDEMIEYMQEAVDMCTVTLNELRASKCMTSDEKWMINSTEDVLCMDQAILEALQTLNLAHKLSEDIAAGESGAGDDYPVTDYAKANQFPPAQPASIAKPNLDSFSELEKTYRNGC